MISMIGRSRLAGRSGGAFRGPRASYPHPPWASSLRFNSAAPAASGARAYTTKGWTRPNRVCALWHAYPLVQLLCCSASAHASRNGGACVFDNEGVGGREPRGAWLFPAFSRYVQLKCAV
jgi:hypothetical protein